MARATPHEAPSDVCSEQPEHGERSVDIDHERREGTARARRECSGGDDPVGKNRECDADDKDENGEACGGTTWAYRFDYPAPSANGGLGSAHLVEVPFVFDNLNVKNTAPRIGDAPSQAVADTAHSVWVKFVTEGDPGWGPYSTAHRTTGILSDTINVIDDPDGDERLLWEGIR